MSYELFLGWRYLFLKRWHLVMWFLAAIFLLLCLGGLFLILYSKGGGNPSSYTHKAIGSLLLLNGGFAFAGLFLFAFFRAFTAISIIGVSIGVAILIWVLSVTSGFEDEFRNKVLGVNAHIVVIKYGQDFFEYNKVIDLSEKLPGVKSAAPFTLTDMMIGKGNRLANVLVKGVDPKRSTKVLDMPRQIVSPPHINSDNISEILTTIKESKNEMASTLPGLIIGKELAEKLEAKIGDPVRLISPLSAMDNVGWSSGTEMPRSRDFLITGIFFSGFSEYDTRLVYLHLKEAQSFFSWGDVVYGVEMNVHDVFKARPLSILLSDRLSKSVAPNPSPYRIIDWSELNQNLFTALRTQKIVLQIVIGFIIVVAAFNVLSALAMLVIRKTREIAILKSMGMSSGGIARIFQSAGLIVWVVGTSLGLLFGYIGCILLRRYGFPLDPKVYLISELPVRLSILDFILTALFALGVCLLATLYPSARASRLHPVDGLRFQ